MMNQQIYGRHIYTDCYNKIYYLNPFDKMYYLINQENSKKYLIYSFRFTYSIILLYLLYVGTTNILISITGACLLYSLLSFTFYKFFIANLSHSKTIKKPVKLSRLLQIKSLSSIRLSLLTVLSLLLSIALILNIYITKYSNTIIYLTYILAAGSFALSIFSLYTFINRLSQKHKSID